MAALKANKTYNATVRGFRLIKGYASLTVQLENKIESVIIGTTEEIGGISGLMSLKGLTMDITYRKEVEINGTKYNQFSLESINF